MTKSKKSYEYNDELDFFDLIYLFWKEKFKIIIILILTILIFKAYDHFKPINYSFSVEVSPASDSTFSKYVSLNNAIFEMIRDNNVPIIMDADDVTFSSRKSHYISAPTVFQEFLLDMKKKESTKKTLSQNPFVKKFNNLDVDLEAQINSMARTFNVVNPRENNNQFFLKFIWHDPDEGKLLAKKMIIQSLLNVRKNFLNDLSYYRDSVETALEVSKTTLVDFQLQEKILASDNIEEWIIFNESFAEIYSLKKTKMTLILSIVVGTILGFVFVLLSLAYKRKNYRIKN